MSIIIYPAISVDSVNHEFLDLMFKNEFVIRSYYHRCIIASSQSHLEGTLQAYDDALGRYMLHLRHDRRA